MLISIVFSQLALATCMPVIPYKSIGKYLVGKRAPVDIVLEKEAPNWGNYQNLRFELDTKTNIKMIQKTMQASTCVIIDKIKISGNISEKEAQRVFPNCKFESRLGGNSLQCDGFELLWSSFKRKPYLRIDVSNQDIDSVLTSRAILKTENIISVERQKSPWKKK